jgi:branched-chain amino acid transport system substrate-binding protein
MSRMKSGVLVAALAAVVSLAFASASATSTAQSAAIYFGMDAPLTGPTQLVGQSDRQAVEAIVRYWNARGGIRGRRVVVDILDNASNPSQAVQNVQRFIGDPKYVAILGSGNAAAAVATGAIASQAGIPFIALSPPTQLVEPPQPYAYVLSATARLYAYSEAAYLRSQGIRRVWLMGDNGGFGRDGPAQVAKIARKYNLEIVDTTIFSPASTDFSAELTKIKGSNAQALWLWTATPAGPTIVKQFKQLQLPQRLVLTGANVSPQFLQGTCGDVNGAIVNSFLATAWRFLPRTNPVRAQAQLLQRMLGRPVSNFDGDTAAALWAYKAAIERGSATRSGINTALETRIRGLITPAGRIFLSKNNHTGLQLDSMWVGRIDNCQVRPLFGAAFGKTK